MCLKIMDSQPSTIESRESEAEVAADLSSSESASGCSTPPYCSPEDQVEDLRLFNRLHAVSIAELIKLIKLKTKTEVIHLAREVGGLTGNDRILQGVSDIMNQTGFSLVVDDELSYEALEAATLQVKLTMSKAIEAQMYRSQEEANQHKEAIMRFKTIHSYDQVTSVQKHQVPKRERNLAKAKTEDRDLRIQIKKCGGAFLPQALKMPRFSRIYIDLLDGAKEQQDHQDQRMAKEIAEAKAMSNANQTPLDSELHESQSTEASQDSELATEMDSSQQDEASQPSVEPIINQPMEAPQQTTEPTTNQPIDASPEVIFIKASLVETACQANSGEISSLTRKARKEQSKFQASYASEDGVLLGAPWSENKEGSPKQANKRTNSSPDAVATPKRKSRTKRMRPDNGSASPESSGSSSFEELLAEVEETTNKSVS